MPELTVYLATAEVTHAEVTQEKWSLQVMLHYYLPGACLISSPGFRIKAGRRLIFTAIQGYFYSD